ncbi:sigma 54-interacting transcriptional regulator [Sporolactobacillus shoreicorticis]|uniref:Sigma-54 interaction domain-containing protein n=1 Tax=Sporolactobacillus shoreicorticis TaxID=1923877 RepID=A0ABW5RZE7_9BACL|nr:sigma 54-interacting transcriptional regulator [Sporolactobacillus shoreicorticis]MCO7127600.1 sigma 54-interacting transcriptional regulator [Sporolactobacillus shoreicorticis]
MKHLLPDFNDLLHTDFVVTTEERWHEPYLSSQSVGVVFVQQGPLEFLVLTARNYSIARKHHIRINELSECRADCMHINDSWATLNKKLQHCDYVVVLRDGAAIGYLKTSELASRVLQAYTYLKAYYDTILETTDDTISVIDNNMDTVVWTGGAERLYSIKKEEILGEPMTRFFPENRLDNLKILNTGKRFYHKQHQPRDDLFVLINSAPVKLGGKIIGAVSCEQDVTYQAQLNKKLTNAKETINHLQKQVCRMDRSVDPFRCINGSSEAIQNTIDKLKQVGAARAKVLLLGESGVGKELFANALHDLRTLGAAPFIPINCGAIPDALFESELFGYEKGAFSGANPLGSKGKFELAKDGTLFLDEIAELPLEMQVKLLRVLQEGTFYSVGGTKLKHADCSIIAATNKNLKELVHKGKFREDLYYRLNIITITIPPLRERSEDIIELSHQFLYEFAEKYGRSCTGIPKEVMMALIDYSWPGNIRELRNIIERLVVFSRDELLNFNDLPVQIRESNQESEMPESFSQNELPENQPLVSLNRAMRECQHRTIRKALEHTNENKNKAAEILGISRTTLYNKMHQLGIS